jgi:hypothetical protein
MLPTNNANIYVVKVKLDLVLNLLSMAFKSTLFKWMAGFKSQLYSIEMQQIKKYIVFTAFIKLNVLNKNLNVKKPSIYPCTKILAFI